MIRRKEKECTGCGRCKPVWKNIGGEPYCQFCAPKYSLPRRERLEEERTVSVPKPIPKKSKKKQVDDTAYALVRKQFFADPRNQFCAVKRCGCGMYATDVHHKKGRGIWLLIMKLPLD